MLKISTVQPISLDNNLMKSLSPKSQNKPDMIELIVDVQEKRAQNPASPLVPVSPNLKSEANTNANNLNMNGISTSLSNNSSTSINVKSGNVPTTTATTTTPRRTSRSY